MPFDPSKWPSRFPPSQITHVIPCPNCEKFELEAGELKTGLTRDSRLDEPEGFPIFSTFRFALLLECKSCRETVAMAGLLHSREEWFAEEEDTVEILTLEPHMIDPPPKLFTIPKSTTAEVKEAITEAFRLYWFDRDACAGRLRTAVELFLTSEGIKEDYPTGGKPIGLSKRLSEYEKNVPTVAKNLEAVKWLGDAGLHRRGINLKSINDGLRQISRALEERYEGLEVDKAANEIIAKKGPRSRDAIIKIPKGSTERSTS